MGALARVVGPFCAGLAFAGISISGPFFHAALMLAPAIWLALAASRRAPAMKVQLDDLTEAEASRP